MAVLWRRAARSRTTTARGEVPARATREVDRATAGPPEPTPAAVNTARWALISLFAVNGLTLSAWVARMPAVRDALGVTPGQLGRVLLLAALGGLLAAVLAPPLVVRLGLARSLRLSGLLFAVAYGILAVGVATGSVMVVAAGLMVNGVAFAGGNLPLNVGSTTVERAARRPILPQFHAAFSIGTVVGSLLAASAAGLGVNLPAQLAVMSVIAVGWRWWATRYLLPEEPRIAPPRPADDGARIPASPADVPARFGMRNAWREPRTLLIGAIAFAAAGSEMGANDWLALAVVDGFLTSESFAAATLSLFVGAMTVVRLLGTPIIARLGRSRTLRVAALVAIAGVVLFVTAPNPTLALVGVAAWGAGSALNFPIAVSAASDDPTRAAYRVSVMSAFGSAAAITSPLVLGALAESSGVRLALLAIAVALVLIVVSAGRATAPPPELVAARAARLTAAPPTAARVSQVQQTSPRQLPAPQEESADARGRVRTAAVGS